MCLGIILTPKISDAAWTDVAYYIWAGSVCRYEEYFNECKTADSFFGDLKAVGSPVNIPENGKDVYYQVFKFDKNVDATLVDENLEYLKNVPNQNTIISFTHGYSTAISHQYYISSTLTYTISTEFNAGIDFEIVKASESISSSFSTSITAAYTSEKTTSYSSSVSYSVDVYETEAYFWHYEKRCVYEVYKVCQYSYATCEGTYAYLFNYVEGSEYETISRYRRDSTGILYYCGDVDDRFTYIR